MMNTIDEIYEQIDMKEFEKLVVADRAYKNRYLIDIIDTIFMEEINKES